MSENFKALILNKKGDELVREVKNIEKTHKRLSEAGVILTDIKDGRKPNTLVTTVKSHTLNIPTLLIEHLSS